MLKVDVLDLDIGERVVAAAVAHERGIAQGIIVFSLMEAGGPRPFAACRQRSDRFR